MGLVHLAVVIDAQLAEGCTEADAVVVGSLLSVGQVDLSVDPGGGVGEVCLLESQVLCSQVPKKCGIG